MLVDTEMDLVNLFIDKISTNRKKTILREVSTNFGRPDILVVNLDEDVISKQRDKRKDINFTKIMSYIMTYLYSRRWIKISTLQDFISYSDRKMSNIISNLLDLNLINVKGKYIKSQPASQILAINRIWAYEAKLAHWKYAVEQAERHLWFTRDSYILLPEVSDNILNKSIRECRFRNVGLSMLNEDSSISVQVKSPKKGIVNSPFIWKLNDEIIRGEIDWENTHNY